MSKPDLYRNVTGNTHIFCVHGFADENRISVRKARRLIRRMLAAKNIIALRRRNNIADKREEQKDENGKGV